jgi:hypothetical protein
MLLRHSITTRGRPQNSHRLKPQICAVNFLSAAAPCASSPARFKGAKDLSLWPRALWNNNIKAGQDENEGKVPAEMTFCRSSHVVLRRRSPAISTFSAHSHPSPFTSTPCRLRHLYFDRPRSNFHTSSYGSLMPLELISSLLWRCTLHSRCSQSGYQIALIDWILILS